MPFSLSLSLSLSLFLSPPILICIIPHALTLMFDKQFPAAYIYKLICTIHGVYVRFENAGMYKTEKFIGIIFKHL